MVQCEKKLLGFWKMNLFSEWLLSKTFIIFHYDELGKRMQGGPLPVIYGVYNSYNKQGHNTSYPSIRPFIGVITPRLTS